jgi:hypothetical protein
MSRHSTLGHRAAERFWLVLVAMSAACGGDDSVPIVEGVIDRETFIEVYVELRASGVRNPGFRISEEARDEILARHGVDEAALLTFVDAYGMELDYMNELWAEVERRIEALPPVTVEPAASGA